MEDALHSLVRRFRHRVMLARVVRHLAWAGVAVAAVCVAAAVLQRVMGMGVLEPAAVASVVAGVVWVAWQLRHWPTLAATALEIDRQEGLQELLSSAVLAKEREGFEGCVAAMAAERAKGVRVEELAVGGHGTAEWVAMLLLVGMLPLVYRGPTDTAERMAGGAVEGTAGADVRPAISQQNERKAAPAQEARSPGASLIGTSSTAEQPGTVAASDRPTRSDMAGNSAGGGLAQSPQSTTAMPPSASGAGEAARGTGTASGGGRADARASGTASGGGQVGGEGVAAGGGGEGAIAERLGGTVDAQSLPEGYRDVFKAYFARPR